VSTRKVFDMDDATKASQAAFVRSMTPTELRMLVGFMIMFMPAIEVAAMLAYVRTARGAIRDQVIRERWFAEQPLSPAESDVLRGLLEREIAEGVEAAPVAALEHAPESPAADGLGYGRCKGCGELWPCGPVRGLRL
jgi:hypothetical protein